MNAKVIKTKLYDTVDGVVALIALLTCFFPYIRLLDLRVDTQPTAVICGTVWLFFFRKKFFRTELLPLAIIAAFSIILFVISPFSFTSIRSVGNYVGLFFMSWFGFEIYRKSPSRLFTVAGIALCVWICVGLCQFFIDKTFLTSLVGSVRTTPNRGVTSLATEPSYYSLTIILIWAITWILSSRFSILFFILMALQVIGLGMSFQSLVIFCLFAGGMVFLYTKALEKIFFLTLFTIFLLIGFEFLLGEIASSRYRIFALMKWAIVDPAGLIFQDESANDRLAHIIMPIMMSFRDYFVPHGFGNWRGFAFDYLNYFPAFKSVSLGARIMSGYGSTIFEIGLIGLLLPITVFKQTFGNLRLNFDQRIIMGILLNAILVVAIPVGHPLLGVLIGVLMAKLPARTGP